MIVRDRPAIIALVRRTYGKLFQYEIYDDDNARARTVDGRGQAAAETTDTMAHAREKGRVLQHEPCSSKRKREEPLTTMGNPSSSYRR